MKRMCAAPASGSSPRVRGKQGAGRLVVEDDGLIPACAGKTTWGEAQARYRTAHPRVCGENVLGTPTKPSDRGSSPRVRGKRRGGRGRVCRFGLIPACAGKTPGAGARRERRPAHPRVCGENYGGEDGQAIVFGSSPRVRGKPHRADRIRAGPGLIPACAGKTRAGARIRASARAHPRVCGENPAHDYGDAQAAGSSPRVRGKPVHGLAQVLELGLIPACAGKTT